MGFSGNKFFCRGKWIFLPKSFTTGPKNCLHVCGVRTIQDLTFFKVKLDSKVDRERLVRIELKQYENMDRAERQLIKSVERVERKEIK